MAVKNPKSASFSAQTLTFLEKAGRQKSVHWLDKNREDYERYLLDPIKHLAATLKSELGPLARGYHFPQKGIARLRRSQASISQGWGGLYKNWIGYTASRPHESRFENNPSVFFMLNTEDKDDPILLAGGLYMPSSRQMRALRETMARDASPFEALFADKEFKRSFPDGFSDERISSRNPRGFDPNHPKMHWIRLQGFFVWRPYTKREFVSPRFAERVARDGRQILRLNTLLEHAIRGTLTTNTSVTAKNHKGVLERLTDVEGIRSTYDF